MIAATRPELLAGCVCIFVHPDDERYRDYVGKMAVVPLYNFEIPMQLSMKDAIPELIITCPAGFRELYRESEKDIMACTGAEKLVLRD